MWRRQRPTFTRRRNARTARATTGGRDVRSSCGRPEPALHHSRGSDGGAVAGRGSKRPHDVGGSGSASIDYDSNAVLAAMLTADERENREGSVSPWART